MLYFGKYVLHNAVYLRFFKIHSCELYEVWVVVMATSRLLRYTAALSQEMRHNTGYQNVRI